MNNQAPQNNNNNNPIIDNVSLGVAGPMVSNAIPQPFGKTCKMSNNTFFCCLRKYRGLKTSGFGVKDKAVEYVPFKLSLSFKEVRGEISDTLLFITATPVKTAYNREYYYYYYYFVTLLRRYFNFHV